MKRWLFDRVNHRATDFIEEPDGSVTFETTQDVAPILEDNKRKYNAYGDKRTPGKQGEWHHAASIPFNVWEQWMKETNGAIERDSASLKKYLNDSDNKYFRTSPTTL